jgi:TerC family integral membrane protein
MSVPAWAWFAAVGAIGGLVVTDITVHRLKNLGGLRPALIETAAWIALSAGFGVVVGATTGWGTSGQYFSGYLLEKSLSVDNVFAFALLLRSFQVPPPDQRRILYWGVVGALVLRAGLVATGAAFVDHVSWAFYPLGLIVVAAGVRMARGGTEIDLEHGRLIGVIRRLVPVAPAAPAGRFLTRHQGRRAATPLLLALAAIEATDLVFAADSIPAIFGVTTNVFIVFTSNAFAVLGLRALYFVLAEAMDRFTHLTKGLAALLVLVGVKMLIRPLVEIPTAATLALIVAVLAFTIGASTLSPRRPAQAADRQALW